MPTRNRHILIKRKMRYAHTNVNFIFDSFVTHSLTQHFVFSDKGFLQMWTELKWYLLF